MSAGRHTQGELHVSSTNSQVSALIFKDGICIAEAFSREAGMDAVANAARLVACWNAHDGLVQQLEGNLIVLGNLGGNHTEENPTTRQSLIRQAWLDTRNMLDLVANLQK